MMLKESIKKEGVNMYSSSNARDPEDSFLFDLDNVISD